MTFSLTLTQAPQHSFYNGGLDASARQYYARKTQHTPNGPRIDAALSGIAPGEFRTVWADASGDIFKVHREDTGVAMELLDWTPRCVWDQATEQIIVGGRRASYKLIAYSDVTGDWREIVMPINLGRFTTGTAHYYGMIEADDSGGIYLGWTGESRTFRMDPVTETYTQIASHLTTNGNNGSMLAWNGSNLYKYSGDAQRWLVYTPGTNSWANPANNLGNGIHALLEYNPTAGVFMLVGGSSTNREVRLVTTAGVATRVTDVPANVTMSPASWIAYHPSGCWLVYSDETKHIYAGWPNGSNTDVTWQDITVVPAGVQSLPTVAADYTRNVLFIVSTSGLYAYAFPEVSPPGSNLEPQDATHAHTADTPTLNTAYNLLVAEVTHAHLVDSAVLSAALNLVLEDATHAHTSEQLALDTGSALSTDSATHAHTAEAAQLVATLSLIVSDVLHEHFADAALLGSAHALGVQDATHSHLAEEPTLALGFGLDAQDASHAHLAEALSLDASIGLIVQNAAHAHNADAATLSTLVEFIIASTYHAHFADSVGAYIPTPIAEALRKAVFARLTQQTPVAAVSTQEHFTRVH